MLGAGIRARMTAYSVVFFLFADGIVWSKLLDNLQNFLLTRQDRLLNLHVDQARTVVLLLIRLIDIKRRFNRCNSEVLLNHA